MRNATAGKRSPGRWRDRRVPKTKQGARVAEARNKAGLSQQALADKIGTPRSTVARIEIGMTTPTLETALAIGRELGESVESLFGGGR